MHRNVSNWYVAILREEINKKKLRSIQERLTKRLQKRIRDQTNSGKSNYSTWWKRQGILRNDGQISIEVENRRQIPTSLVYIYCIVRLIEKGYVIFSSTRQHHQQTLTQTRREERTSRLTL